MLVVVCCTQTGYSLAVEIISHPDVTARELSVSTARAMFGMRQTVWPDGTPVRVFVLPEQNSLHGSFCKEILNLYPYQLSQSWNRLVYSGTGQAPTIVASEQDMLAKVAAIPGAIGYINKVTGNEPVHKITVR